MKKESMSKRPSAWVLPPSYDLENLRGILGPQTLTVSSSPVSTSLFTLLQWLLHSPPQKRINFVSALRSTSYIPLLHHCALSQLSELSSLVTQSPRSPRYLPVPTANHFLNHSLFLRCGSSSSMRASPLSATQVIRYEKELRSQPIATASPSMISSS